MQNDLVEAVAQGSANYGLQRLVARDGSEVWQVRDSYHYPIGGDYATLGSALEAFRLAVVSASIPIVAEYLREPTPAMIEAGVSALAANGVDDPNEVDAVMCWRAMLDAAAIRAAGSATP